jgi:hypothetical protein
VDTIWSKWLERALRTTKAPPAKHRRGLAICELLGQDLNLRPSGYENDFTQPADGRRPSRFQLSSVVRRSAKSTEVHAGILKSPSVWTRFGQSFRPNHPNRRPSLGNSGGRHSRTLTALHSEHNPSLGTGSQRDPQTSHAARQRPSLRVRLGSSPSLPPCPNWVCAATVYPLCEAAAAAHPDFERHPRHPSRP